MKSTVVDESLSSNTTNVLFQRIQLFAYDFLCLYCVRFPSYLAAYHIPVASFSVLIAFPVHCASTHSFEVA